MCISLIFGDVELGLQDNDSDLEYELEAVPLVNNESATEAAACVKVYCINCMLFEGNEIKFRILVVVSYVYGRVDNYMV